MITKSTASGARKARPGGLQEDDDDDVGVAVGGIGVLVGVGVGVGASCPTGPWDGGSSPTAKALGPTFTITSRNTAARIAAPIANMSLLYVASLRFARVYFINQDIHSHPLIEGHAAVDHGHSNLSVKRGSRRHPVPLHKTNLSFSTLRQPQA